MRIFLPTTVLIALFISSLSQAEPKKTFRDCPQCPEMISIPPGKFLMGTKRLMSREGLSEEQLKLAGEFEEYPQHEVTIKSFSMGIHEITQKEWIFIMGSNPSENKGDDLPVENITWEEAKAFAHKLSEITGKNYRLPTEAEWEYAARAGSKSIFYFGDKYSKALDFTVTNHINEKTYPLMGSYGIGVSRLVAAFIEANHDENGIIFNKTISPFTIIVNPLSKDEEIQDLSNKLYLDLLKSNIKVILNDKDASAETAAPDDEL